MNWTHAEVGSFKPFKKWHVVYTENDQHPDAIDSRYLQAAILREHFVVACSAAKLNDYDNDTWFYELSEVIVT